MKITISCIQMNSRDDISRNVEQALMLSNRAVDEGAQYICYPENMLFMAKDEQQLMANCYPEKELPFLPVFQDYAKKHSVVLSLGSLAIKDPFLGKLWNRSYLIDSKGDIIQSYDKMHLYDASVHGGETHRESKRYQAGESPIKVDLGGAVQMGMSICYDLRFPYLYRYLASNGANIILVPSAFTAKTGEAHWHVLLRARAIETGAFIVAAAQTGQHPRGRKTFGHSLIINPWGEVIEDAKESVGTITASLDLEEVKNARAQIPCLQLDHSHKML